MAENKDLEREQRNSVHMDSSSYTELGEVEVALVASELHCDPDDLIATIDEMNTLNTHFHIFLDGRADIGGATPVDVEVETDPVYISPVPELLDRLRPNEDILPAMIAMLEGQLNHSHDYEDSYGDVADYNAVVSNVNTLHQHYHSYYNLANAAGNKQSGSQGFTRNTSRVYLTQAAHVTPDTAQQKTSTDQMADILSSLLSHAHTYRDDYGNACNCNCNCNCNCTRGIV